MENAPHNGLSHRTRANLAFAGFLLITGFFLFTEHRAHLFGMLPFLLLLTCLVLHLFMHSGHVGHGGQERSDQVDQDKPKGDQ